jgi:hypothetical protein
MHLHHKAVAVAHSLLGDLYQTKHPTAEHRQKAAAVAEALGKFGQDDGQGADGEPPDGQAQEKGLLARAVRALRERDRLRDQALAENLSKVRRLLGRFGQN